MAADVSDPAGHAAGARCEPGPPPGKTWPDRALPRYDGRPGPDRGLAVGATKRESRTRPEPALDGQRYRGGLGGLLDGQSPTPVGRRHPISRWRSQYRRPGRLTAHPARNGGDDAL